MAVQYGNYVKFIRGTEKSWANLSPEEISSDTLYFISNTGSASGKLYLGSKLISNGALTSATSLKDLNDVIVSAGIVDKSILVYDLTSGKWQDKSLIDVFLEMAEVFKGASSDTDGLAGLVPAPKAGEEDYFLKGDGTWANPISGVMDTITAVQDQIAVIVGDDAEMSMRDVATEAAETAVATIVADAPERFDTLKEIAQWIIDNQDAVDVSGLTGRVKYLEDIVYGVPANEETGQEATLGLHVIVPNLEILVEDLESTVESHDTDINLLKEALRWQDLLEN